MNGASYFSCQIKNVYITLSILYDSMGGGGHHCSLIVIDLLLSYLKKVRGVGRNAGGEDRKTLTQRRLGGGGSISLSRSFTKVYAPSCVLGYNSCINRKNIKHLANRKLTWMGQRCNAYVHQYTFLNSYMYWIFNERGDVHLYIINRATIWAL